MRYLSTEKLNYFAEQLTNCLYMISITDPWYPNASGNTQKMTSKDQIASMELVLAGIKYTNGRAPSVLGGRYITQDTGSWLAQGSLIFLKKSGTSMDCAATVANLMLQAVNKSIYKSRIEILTINQHAFVVVNRKAALISPEHWGENAFIIDLWFSNQFPKFQQKAVFWANDYTHPIQYLIRTNAIRLRVAVVINAGGPEHAIIPLISPAA